MRFFCLVFEELINQVELATLIAQFFLDILTIENIFQIDPVLLTNQPIINGSLSMQNMVLSFFSLLSQVPNISRT